MNEQSNEQPDNEFGPVDLTNQTPDDLRQIRRTRDEQPTPEEIAEEVITTWELCWKYFSRFHSSERGTLVSQIAAAIRKEREERDRVLLLNGLLNDANEALKARIAALEAENAELRLLCEDCGAL